MKKTLSLRAKVLLLLTLLPLLSVGVFALIAIDTFKKDKVAYIFDSNSSFAIMISTQIKAKFEALVEGVRPFLKEAILTKNQAYLNKIPEEIDSIQGMFIISGEVGQEKLEYNWLKDSEKLSEIYPAIVQQVRLANAVSQTGVGQEKLRSLSPGGPLMLVEAISTVEANADGSINTEASSGKSATPVVDEKRYFVMVFDVGELKDGFQVTEAQSSVLFSPRAGLLLGQSTGAASLPELNSLFVDGDVGGLKSTIVDFPGFGEFLVSYAKVSFGDAYVVSLVPRAKAFAALTALQKKVILFLIIIAAAMVLISIFVTHSLLDSLVMLTHATKKVSQGDFNVTIPVKQNDEVGVLSASFNTMAKEVKRLLLETAETARMQGELHTAKTVQETLFPAPYQNFGNVEINGFYEPASECGGDWWHYTYNESQNKVLFWLGDATGHGAPAALITSAAKSASAILELMEISPKEILRILNRCIYEVSRGKIMMTFIVAEYDLNTHKLVYSNASHEPPFQVHRQGDQQLKKKDLLLWNEVSGPRLGQALGSEYTEHEIDIEPNDLVLFYTDGIADIINDKKESFGERNLVKTFLKAANEGPIGADVLKIFNTELQTFRKDVGLLDDLTFFFIRRLE